MPRNKRPQDREEKTAEIVAVARRLFLEEGYEATAMSKLAAGAGIAANTIYWYFRDKDDVLLAVLDAVLADAWQAYVTTAPTQLADRLLWLVERLDETSKLITTVHSRIAVSASIDAWHDGFHGMSEAVLRGELNAIGVVESELDAVVKIWVFTVEGLLVHQFDQNQRRAICESLVRQLPMTQ
ncbi:TetR/AcrR family transcriptional regulator [Antrihabitans spumae]|jgi:TetR/AcrR family transcriptional regulator, cholesterol catabolism regulator|uniref:Helix-turn-helix domain-containing protein n=1 Tax=Antrihabitans spumae TaxID=3373370 RepID=A0ABW7JKK9_9NOCA